MVRESVLSLGGRQLEPNLGRVIPKTKNETYCFITDNQPEVGSHCMAFVAFMASFCDEAPCNGNHIY